MFTALGMIAIFRPLLMLGAADAGATTDVANSAPTIAAAAATVVNFFCIIALL
jgi:hypothetical protein